MHVISTFLQFPTFEPFEFWYSNTCIVFNECVNLIMHRLSKFDIIDRVILFVVFVLATLSYLGSNLHILVHKIMQNGSP